MDKQIKSVLNESFGASGKTKEQIAAELNVTEKTIKNWLSGRSQPNAQQFLDWFPACGLNPIPYVYNYYFPTHTTIRPSTEDKRVRDAFNNMIKLLTTRQMRIIMFAMKQKSSDVLPLFELFLCYLQNGQFNRIINASDVVTAYELSGPYEKDAIQPDINIIKNAINNAKEAYKHGHKGYIILERNGENENM